MLVVIVVCALFVVVVMFAVTIFVVFAILIRFGMMIVTVVHVDEDSFAADPDEQRKHGEDEAADDCGGRDVTCALAAFAHEALAEEHDRRERCQRQQPGQHEQCRDV